MAFPSDKYFEVLKYASVYTGCLIYVYKCHLLQSWAEQILRIDINILFVKRFKLFDNIYNMRVKRVYGGLFLYYVR